MIRKLAMIAAGALLLAACHDQAAGGAGARDQIRVVGSSTVYPFTAIVAEHFLADQPHARPPVIESTGTGAGIKLFCAGPGAAHADIVDASRRMSRREYEACAHNGAGELLEVEIGLDGIAFAHAPRGTAMALTLADLCRALAAMPGGRPNKAHTWREVNPLLPPTRIEVYGPPATSGTRDALVRMILARGCPAEEPPARCRGIREDGAYIDTGESDNLIVRKLVSNPDAIGVFGFSYLEENANMVRGLPIGGVLPSRATIADGSYPGARPLYLYVKKARLDVVPGLRRFLSLYARSWGENGPLARRGLIAAPPETQARSAAIVRDETPLDPRTLR
ncbi:MAG: substrate-binding domain-containing protein [Sphingomonas bacterium]